MAYPGECPSVRDSSLLAIRTHIDEMSLEVLPDPKNAEYQRALIARFNMFVIISLESLWNGARLCPGGLPQKTTFEAKNDKPDQANFAQYALLVADAVSYMLELQEKVIVPFFISQGVKQLEEISPALHSIQSLIADLRTFTTPFLTAPSVFDPPTYQAHVAALLTIMLPVLGQTLDLIDVETIELALNFEDRKLINKRVLESWRAQDASAFDPLWSCNNNRGPDFPKHGNWTKSALVNSFGKQKYAKCWRFTKYPGKLGLNQTFGAGGYFSAQAIMGGAQSK